VTVSTVKTLSLYPEAFNNYLERIQCLVIDECQHVPAKTFTDVSNRCLNAFVRCGLSATPYDEDDVLKKLQVKYILGDTTITVRSPELIDRKIISPVTLFYVKITTPETVIVKYKDGEEAFDTWDLPYKQRLVKGSKIVDIPGAYEELIVRNDHRNRLFAKWMASKTRPTLGIVNWKEHGERLQQLLGCPFVTGDEPAKVRLKLIKDMSEGRLLHALCTPIFDEGINAPAIKYMALPAGGKAAGRLRQRIGRGVRRTGSDDDHLEVLDALDMTNKTLARHSAERIKIAVKSGFKIKEITGEDF
jgi:superfamily II DNA or RNA helicase